jgi:glycosyltransferase involved in cell wall biosynthesis
VAVLRFLLLAEASDPSASSALAAAVAAHHPEGALTWLLCDPRPIGARPGSEADDVWSANRRLVGSTRYVDVLMATSPEFARWAVIPGVVRELLAGSDRDTVVVLPTSVHLAGSLDELIRATDGGAALLARDHDVRTGVSSGGHLPDVGVFGPRSADLLATWEKVAEEWSRTAELPAARRDAPWTTFVPDSASLTVVGTPACRVHPATVDTMTLGTIDTPSGAQVEVDGVPLVLAWFPDFDPERPYWYVEPGSEQPRVSVGRSTGLRQLTHARAAELRRHGWQGAPSRDPVIPRSIAGPISDLFRADLAAVADGAAPPPNPYVSGEVARFMDWMSQPGDDSATGLSRAADATWVTRPDLAAVFQNVRWSGRNSYSRWLWTSGLDEGDTALAVLPEPPRPARRIAAATERRFGVNLVGYHQSDAGLGVAVRRMARALDEAEIPWVPIAYDRTSSRQRASVRRDLDAPYHFNLVLVTAEQLPYLVGDMGSDLLHGRYTIGLWYWETDVMRQHQRSSFNLVDEVWGATTYLKDVFAKHTDKPVELVNLPLEFDPPTDRPEARRVAGLDDRFTFLFTFDFLSVVNRKNPLGLVEAYRRAFPTVGTTRLVLKSINGSVFPREREQLLDAIADRSDIELWDRYLGADERLALVAGADCFASLHRSEGLGLTMAEAMAAGTPVIASAYSGSLDFMDERSALLVGGREIEIGPGQYYPANGHWFDPDLDQAAGLMRLVHDDADLREQLSSAGRRAIARFSAGRTGERIRQRLQEVWTAERS